METQLHSRRGGSALLISLGVVLLIIGLAGHLLAAHAGGGSALFYEHHVFGFFLLTAVSAVIVVLAGRFFWRGRHDISLVIVGAIQTVLGLLIYTRMT